MRKISERNIEIATTIIIALLVICDFAYMFCKY